MKRNFPRLIHDFLSGALFSCVFAKIGFHLVGAFSPIPPTVGSRFRGSPNPHFRAIPQKVEQDRAELPWPKQFHPGAYGLAPRTLPVNIGDGHSELAFLPTPQPGHGAELADADGHLFPTPRRRGGGHLDGGGVAAHGLFPTQIHRAFGFCANDAY